LQRGFFLADMGEREDLVVFKGREELAKTFSNKLNYFYNILKLTAFFLFKVNLVNFCKKDFIKKI
jgi:hypothetical protein